MSEYKENYPTDNELEVLELLKDHSLNFDGMLKKLGIDEGELKKRLEGLQEKGMIEKCAPPIFNEFNKTHYVLLHVMKILQGLEEKGLVKCKNQISHEDSFLNAERYAQEHGWERPTEKEIGQALRIMLSRGDIEPTDLGQKIFKHIKEKNEQ